jgi:IS5 family transposase
MVDAVPAVKGPGGRPGRPRKRPAKLHCDKGYDYPRCRRALRRRGVTPRIARRGVESSQRLGRHRYVVEWSLAWLVGYRRLQVRYERRADIVLGFVQLACVLICLNSLADKPDVQDRAEATPSLLTGRGQL